MIKQIRYQMIRTCQIGLWIVSKLVLSLSKTSVHKNTEVVSTHSAMVISNHISLRDSLFFVGTLSWREFRSLPPLRAIVGKWYFHSLLLPVFYLIGCYPARPLVKSLKPYAGVAAAVKFMSQGYSIGIYPEGRRATEGRIPARGGVVRMLQGYKPEAIYLCHISRQNGLISIVTDRQDSVKELTDADQIMDAVFALKHNHVQ